MNIGLYFGSFNPVHTGHLIIANYLVSNVEIDQVWFVVSPQNPLKHSSSLLNEYHRLHLIQSAIDGENKLKVSNVEFQLPKPSYTVDTLTYLKEKYSHHRFSIIMGSDSFQNINKWKNHEVILNNYPLYIYQRPGFELTETDQKGITLVQAPLLEISSTYIRKLVKENKSIRYFVPDIVMEEITRNNYYR